MDILHKVLLLPIGFIFLLLIGLSSAVTQPTVSGVPNANDRLSGYLSIDERNSTQTGEFLFNVTVTFYGDPGTVKPTGSIAPQYVTVSTNGTNQTRVYTVTNIDALDRDSGTGGRSSMKLDFLVTDQSGNQVNFHVTLYLNDINDNSPIFKEEPYTWSIPEKPFNSSASFVKIKATDYDNGANGHIVYSMTPVTQSAELRTKYSETFKINNSTGDVTLHRELDYETNNYYQFTVVAQDKGSPSRNTTSNLIIRVIDVQDMPPFFTGNLYHPTIHENVPEGFTVITVNARDGDPGVSNDVNYTISGGNGCQELFNISSNGVISTDAPIDRDNGPIKLDNGECKLEITATEIETPGQKNYGKTNATTHVTILVSDEDDNSPVVANSSYFGTLHENPAEGTRINFMVPINVSDKDQGQNAGMKIIVKFADGTPCDDFEPIPETVTGTGTINLVVTGNANKTLLDYEQNKEINLQITVEEVINSSRNHSAEVNITLLNVNDNYPVFSQPNYDFNLTENSNNRTNVGTVMATDADSTMEKNETLKFSISGGMNKFAIDPVSGIIYTNCKSGELDRERIDEYYLTVTVNDEANQSNSTTLIIHILDANDNSPTFAQDFYPVYMEENDNKYNDTNPFVTVKATDSDQVNTDNSTISYSLLNSTQSNFLKNVTIDNSTGSIWLNTPIDFERLTTPGTDQKLVELVVQATDGGNPNRTGSTTVNLFVRDANDNDPIFTNGKYTGTVQENETSTLDDYTSVGYVNATDADGTERNSRVNYFILSGASDRFTINISTGEVKIQLNAHLNREDISSYNLSIVAIDQGSPPRSGSTSMVVTVTDVNDEPPKFGQETYEESILENKTDLGVIAHCVAVDRDYDNLLEYKISSIRALDEDGREVNMSLLDGWFLINSTNGDVTVSGDQDREIAETIELTLLVTDEHAYDPKPQNATARLTITLQDINDNTPVFDHSTYNVSISENALNRIQLMTIKASDADENRTITYKIINGPDPTSSFKIGANTGTISKDGYIDRETNETVILTVRATDNGVPSRNSTAVVHVDIVDFNDNPPVFSKPDLVNIPEGCDNHTDIFNMSSYVTDKDTGDNAKLTFSLRDSGTNFTIDLHTGEISLKTNFCLDREKKDKYELTLIAKDNPKNIDFQKSSSVTATVIIKDINDNSPVFTRSLYTKELLENVPVGTPVLTVSAFDKDKPSTCNSNITYSLETTYYYSTNLTSEDLFHINASSGEITVNSSLESLVGSYSIVVMASDCGTPSQKNTTNVTVGVLDVNLNKPRITELPPNNILKIYECAIIGRELHTFNYSDKDHGINSRADFIISELGDPISIINNTFTLNPNGSLFLKTKLDANSKKTYTFQIQAIDKGTPRLPSEKHTITIIVVDVNDHLPGFNKTTEYRFSVKENITSVVTVGTVIALDEDKDSVPCYSIEASEWSDYFTISNTSGVIKNTKPLDRENTSAVNITVTVNDCTLSLNESSLCTSFVPKRTGKNQTTVTIQVLDIDDNPPKFVNKKIATGMKRDTKPGTALEINLKNSTYITDNDHPINGQYMWIFENNGKVMRSEHLKDEIKIESGDQKCTDGKQHVFCISPNGSIVSNRFISETLSGYFIVPVMVRDNGGNDTANITIYLISNSQLLTMTIRNSKENVALTKDNILEFYSTLTGYDFVYDNLLNHMMPNGQIVSSSSDLYFHVVNPVTQQVLGDEEALALLDRFANTPEMNAAMNNFHITTVDKYKSVEVQEDQTKKNFYILIGITVGEALIIIVVVYVFFSSRSRLNTKLKAANIKTPDMKKVQEASVSVPGSNQYSKTSNPLLNADVADEHQPRPEDAHSLSSEGEFNIDDNMVDATPVDDTLYDRMEEKEVTLDMYTDDSRGSMCSEDLLGATLQLHELRRSTEMLDKLEEGPSTSKLSGHMFNEAFEEEMECTEI